MNCTGKVTDEIIWVGGNDRRLNLFENAYPIPRGVSYNAYVVLDEQTVLVDTVDKAISDLFLENLEAALSGRTLKSNPSVQRVGFMLSKNAGKAREGFGSLEFQSRSAARVRRPRALIVRPESTGFPQNPERVAGAPASPSASLSKDFLDKLNPSVQRAGLFKP